MVALPEVELAGEVAQAAAILGNELDTSTLTEILGDIRDGDMKLVKRKERWKGREDDESESDRCGATPKTKTKNRYEQLSVADGCRALKVRCSEEGRARAK